MLICFTFDKEPRRAVGAAAPCDAGGVGLETRWTVECA